MDDVRSSGPAATVRKLLVNPAQVRGRRISSALTVHAARPANALLSDSAARSTTAVLSTSKGSRRSFEAERGRMINSFTCFPPWD